LNLGKHLSAGVKEQLRQCALHRSDASKLKQKTGSTRFNRLTFGKPNRVFELNQEGLGEVAGASFKQQFDTLVDTAVYLKVSYKTVLRHLKSKVPIKHKFIVQVL
jgi:hypothetical protein